MLHASALLVRVSARPLSSSPPTQDPFPDAIPVSIEPRPPEAGLRPGGGSEEPDPTGQVRAVPEGPPVRPARVVRVGRAAVPRDEPTVGETEKPTGAQAESTRKPDLLSAPEDHGAPLFVQPRRAVMIQGERTIPAVGDRSNQPPSTSRFLGAGPGANGGPGGPGSGWGRGKDLVTRQFTFGGRSGAFRGEVCFFEEHVRSLGEIKDCKPAATFYTATLSVPPRRFTEGFPGVSSRIEWFAIRYRGKFQVTRAGTYKFRLLSDDGSMLFIDGRCVVSNDGQHPPTSREGHVALDAGTHDLFVNYYQGPRESIALQLFVTPEAGTERLLGPVL
jgi:hypothetical protein